MILVPEAFEFVTDAGTRLPLEGVLLGGTDQNGHRITEHLILNRAGAIHQAQGQGPRRTTFRCLLQGPNAKQNYLAIEAAQALQPFGTLVHPWFGAMPAVFRELTLTYDFDASTNSLEFEAQFTESQLRRPAPRTPAGSVAAAQQQAQALAARPEVVAAPRLASKVAVVLLRVSALGVQIATDPSLTTQPLKVALAGVSQAVDEVLAVSGGSDRGNGWVAYAARTTFARCLDAYNLAAASRPPVVVRRVDGSMSLPRFVAQMYGGGAAAMETEILALNRVRPLAIPTGTRLLIPDPEWVRRSLA